MIKLIDKYGAIAAVQDTAKVIEHMDSVQDGEVKRTARAVTRILEGLPTIEAEPVRHGKWSYFKKYDDDYNFYQCSVCKSVVLDYDKPYYLYCPNCGARLKEEWT